MLANDGRNTVLQTCYFSFTSLTTVGFGDYYPVSVPEKILFIFIFLFGILVFSYIQGEFKYLLSKMQEFDFEDEYNL